MKLARVNTLLTVLIVLVNGYVAAAPLFPRFAYWWQDHHHDSDSTVALNAVVNTRPSLSNPVPKGDWLVMPSMHLDAQILEGANMSVLARGPWRRPNTSTPDKGGNTVIVGHRYTYTNPRGTFYFLNLVKPNDPIVIFWQGKKYNYTVTSVTEVKSDATSVEAATPDPRLTLYTCTPLWLPKDRLVVVATLTKVTA